jgi:1-deoxy-D-xylulose-5-phosphate reductoisomerase
MMKKIAILGSTGSIGRSTLSVSRHLKERIQVVALAARNNIELLEIQANEFNPKLIAVFEEQSALQLQKRLPHIPVLAGLEGLKAVAAFQDASLVVAAISGTMGLVPVLSAIEAGKTIGLANKEALVSGGALVMEKAKKHNAQIIPIDSEHSALFQCLKGEPKAAVRRLILTASGGPFRTYSTEQLEQVTVEQALRHPTWVMGDKVTIDCSTLMNKGLEVIEAHWLFDMPIEKISVLIHPQSIIHSLVEFIDNSLLAQLGESSMIIPIQYALTYPERVAGNLKPFDFTQYSTLQFSLPETDRFRCLRLAFDAVKAGGTLSCFMNAANEVLVEAFLAKRLSWNRIATMLESLMQKHINSPIASLEHILHTDTIARREAAEMF